MTDKMSDAHVRWIKRLCRTWPEGVPAWQPEPDEAPVSGRIEPRPEIWRDLKGMPDPEGMCMQCLQCRYYVELSGELGADWGACTNELSQYDGQLVFEHWTCREWAEEIESLSTEVSVRIDYEILNWLMSKEDGDLAKINDILRDTMMNEREGK